MWSSPITAKKPFLSTIWSSIKPLFREKHLDPVVVAAYLAVLKSSKEGTMASLMKQRKKVIKNKLRTSGRDRKRALAKGTTPKFPIHLEDEPVKKAPVKKAPVKKAPVKKASTTAKPEAKKAPVKTAAAASKPEAKKAPVKTAAAASKPEAKKAPVKTAAAASKPEAKKAPVKTAAAASKPEAKTAPSEK
jgi:hypothetical protein